MPLKIDFKSGDKMMINGAVIENIGPNAKLLIHNEAAILREKEVLTTTESNTPASRVYFSLQCAYMFPDKKEDYLTVSRRFLADYLQACPSATEIGDNITKAIDDGHIYKALKACQGLVRHEERLLKDFQHDIEDLAELDQEDLGLEERKELEPPT